MKVLGWHLWFLTWYMRKGSSLEDVDVPENGLRGYGHCWCMILFYPKDDTLKVLYWYLYWKCVRIGGPRRSDLGGHWGFLTGYLVVMVIPDALFYLILPQGKHSESFVLTSVLEVCQEWRVKNGGTWRILRVPDWRLGGLDQSWCHWWSYFTPWRLPWKFCVDIFIRSVSGMGVKKGGVGGYWWFLTGDMKDMVILDALDDLVVPQESYPESFRFLYLCSVKLSMI